MRVADGDALDRRLLAFIEKRFNVFIDLNRTNIGKVNSIGALTRLIAERAKRR